jgi:hypothetical protein
MSKWGNKTTRKSKRGWTERPPRRISPVYKDTIWRRASSAQKRAGEGTRSTIVCSAPMTARQ